MSIRSLTSSPAQSPEPIRQGITTDIMSADGFSLAGLSPDRMSEMCDYLAPFYGPRRPSWDWRGYAEYLERFDRRVALNVIPQVPFNALRAEAVGWEARRATRDELERMKAMAREMMEAGATGLQLGLDYYPAAAGSDAGASDAGGSAALAVRSSVTASSSGSGAGGVWTMGATRRVAFSATSHSQQSLQRRHFSQM